MRLLLAAITLIGSFSSAFCGELVLFERDGCPYCAAWNREIAPTYGKSSAAALLPLKRVNQLAPRPKGYEAIAEVKNVPTFVVMSCGKEVGRFLGYRDAENFWITVNSAADWLRKYEKPGKC